MSRRLKISIACLVALVVLGACSSSGAEPGAERDSTTSRPDPNPSSSGPTAANGGSTTTSIPTPPSTAGGVLGPVAGHTIVVDAGHNGGNSAASDVINAPVFIGTQSRACDTTGTQTNAGYPEHAFTLDVAVRLQQLLTAAGAKVVMVRTNDTGVGPCIDERAAIGNRAHAEAGISIHGDGGPESGRGFHVNTPANIPGYTDDIYAASQRLGLDFRDAYAEGTEMPTSNYFGTNGMKERTDFGGLNLSDVPKVLFESGNMRNATDAALMSSPEFRQRVAQALAVGFARYFSGR